MIGAIEIQIINLQELWNGWTFSVSRSV